MTKKSSARSSQKSGRPERLYKDLAWTFPIITPLDHYIEETRQLWSILQAEARIPVKELLHLGCGGGHNDHIFKEYARVTGIDLSEPMLELARALNPEVVYRHGDIRTLRLRRRFDAVVAIDSFAYLTTERDLQASFQTAFLHLNPGGVFMFLLEETKETFRQDGTTHFTNRRGEVEITFIENRHDPDPGDTSYEAVFLYLIRRKGRLKIETDVHRCGLFAREDVLAMLRKAGFEAGFKVYEPPRAALEYAGLAGYDTFPLFIGRKQ